LSRETTSRQGEADQLTALVTNHATELASAALGKSFELRGARFRLHAKNRNTIYRVGAQFDWFLKLAPATDSLAMQCERLGSDYCNRVLGDTVGYAGPFVSRVSLTPPFVLADALNGPPLTRVLFVGAWARQSPAQVEKAFATLGTLLSVLHADRTLPPSAPEASKRPFAVVKQLAEKLRVMEDDTVDTVRGWSEADRGGVDDSFIHGNLRLDNLLLTPSGIGFVDFENCGRGPRYQDASRPITQLLLLRASLAAPTGSIDRILAQFMASYGEAQPYDLAALGDWVAVRLARYYLESARRTRPGFIGGLPVVRARLATLTRRLIRDGLGAVVRNPAAGAR
jgi:aminoglycoside phosphotransferase (APT) family kinase protein